MSDDPPPIERIIGGLKSDLLGVNWRVRLQTILLTAGILAFGAMLGVHWFAAQTFSALPPLVVVPEYAHLQDRYVSAMKVGFAVATVCLCAGVALELSAREAGGDGDE